MEFSLGELAVRFGCELMGDPDLKVRRVATLRDATPDAVAFLANPVYQSQLPETRAGVVVLSATDAAKAPGAALVAENPYLVYARIADVLHPFAELNPGRHPSAVIGANCTVPDSCEISANVVLADGAVLGESVYIGANTSLGAGVKIGDYTRINSNVSIYSDVHIGSRCVLHSSVVVGADGFGFAPDKDGSWVRVPQIGGVRIGNDVDIGACTNIDRGAIESTRIEDGVKLDNQIQIGHNVVIGKHTIVAGQAGISGSTTIGSCCMIGGRAAIAGHITVADNVVIAGGAMATKSIRKPGMYAGFMPIDDAAKWRRNAARIRQLDDMARRLKKLEEQE
ncbi:MAG: UDP-3-O-(3-hydroxymyristoyl)glucosamine N-acyltransferase [Gammaproteobacteria bacterium]